ncbi:NAD(P)-dependent oxidoreductase [Actinacidiphila glaucinigra]|uniref:3-hydroxyisobutyrate dehydrogenase n=1 Tax=Actinacidiphila glaucinigra TaxID=235986 RepID=A0A239MT15_9ACTN|nr:NAD(P)-dependent oxidoreductase [Actinacidiphila glaucinigra]SNT45896.1 3-hydroxyisobutyrate dehydrogenase [Actinacidiphila glaucinigra]
MTHVSVAGLGNMGKSMVHRLLATGIGVTVWNRSPAAVDELVALGAKRAGSVAELFAAGPVLSVLADDAAVTTVFDEAVLAEVGPEAVHVGMSTISVAAGRALAERHQTAGVGYLAVPVLGRPAVAEAGQLNLLAAGDGALIDSLEPVFSVLGRRTWWVGEHPWQANVVKITMNLLIIHALEAMAEGFTLAERHGVDARELHNLITGTLMPGPVYQGYGKAMADREYLPAGFRTALGNKDLGLAQAAAESVGLELPAMSALRQTFLTAIDLGKADHDWASIAEVLRRA